MIEHALQRHIAAVLCQNPAGELGMVGEILHEQIQPPAAGAHLPVAGAVEHPADAGIEDGTGTHGTGFQRHIQITAGKPPIPSFPCPFAQTEDLGVGSGIAGLFPAVMIRPEDLFPAHKHGTDRDFPFFQRFFCFLKREKHRLHSTSLLFRRQNAALTVYHRREESEKEKRYCVWNVSRGRNETEERP
mgnify:CR=1 FL=1